MALMIDYYRELESAIKIAPPILLFALQKVIEEGHCPNADGFEGPETFPDCEKCDYCLTKKALKAEDE